VKVYKYTLQFSHEDAHKHESRATVVFMPEGAQVLTAGNNGSGPRSWSVDIWARVNPDGRLVPRRFEWASTGQDVADTSTYIATFREDWLVIHLFACAEGVGV
jgi:hypothetical protein